MIFLVRLQRLQHVLPIRKYGFQLNKPLTVCFSIISKDTKSKEAFFLLEKIHQDKEMLKYYTSIDKKLQQTPYYNNAAEERLVHTVKFLNGVGFSHVDALLVIGKAPEIMNSLPETMMKCVDWMKRMGLTDNEMLKTIKRDPRMLICMDQRYEAVSEWLLKQGVCPSKTHTMILKTTRLFKYCIDEKLDLKIDFLRSLGLNQAQIANIIQRAPMMFSLSLERLQQTVDFVLEKGYSQEQVIQIISRSPTVLISSIERLQQTMDFFLSKGYSQEQVIQILCNAPTVLTSSKDRLQGRMDFLFQKGYNEEQVIQIISRGPNVFSYTIDRLQGTIDFFLSKGYTQEQVMKLLLRQPTTLGLSITNMQEKLDLLTEMFGNDLILDRCPHLIARNANEMHRVLKFLKEELEWDVERIQSDVSVLLRNMDTFLLPRYQFLKELEEKEMTETDKPLERKQWTSLPDSKFHVRYPTYQDFLKTYQKKYPQY